jgi:hypothetical protein
MDLPGERAEKRTITKESERHNPNPAPTLLSAKFVRMGKITELQTVEPVTCMNNEIWRESAPSGA